MLQQACTVYPKHGQSHSKATAAPVTCYVTGKKPGTVTGTAPFPRDRRNNASRTALGSGTNYPSAPCFYKIPKNEDYATHVRGKAFNSSTETQSTEHLEILS